jgi:hypothetical protein
LEIEDLFPSNPAYMSGGYLPPAPSALYTEILPGLCRSL